MQAIRKWCLVGFILLLIGSLSVSVFFGHSVISDLETLSNQPLPGFTRFPRP